MHRNYKKEYHMRSRYENYSSSYFTKDELSTFAIRVCVELESSLPEDDFLMEETAVIRGENDIVTALKSRSSTNKFTGLVEVSDKKRDKLYRVIKRKLKNDIDLAEYDPAQAVTAEQLLKLIDENPVNLIAGYAKENAQLNRLLDVFKKPENDTLVQGSSVSAQIAALIAEQQNLENLQADQNRLDTETLKGEVKKNIAVMIFHLNGILSYLELRALSNGATYETSAARVEEIINAMMAPARARASKKTADMAMAE